VVAKKLAKTNTSEELDARLTEVERKLDRLRGLYESFFLGVERTPPNVPRREMNRLILELQQEVITNSSLRFRFQSLSQRWVLFTAYWNRTMREIESGTYRRDLSRAQRYLASKGGLITEQEAIALGIPATRAKVFVERQQKLVAARLATADAAKAAVPAATVAKPAAAAPAIPGVSEADVTAFYQRYVETHKKIGDSKPPMPLDKIRERLRTQIPKVLVERNCSRVTLEVAVEGGKVRLRAWPVAE
jgi:hypothetical protein